MAMGEVRFHRAVFSQVLLREAIKGVDRNRRVELATFSKQRRGFRNAWVSDKAGVGSRHVWFTLAEIRVRADRVRLDARVRAH